MWSMDAALNNVNNFNPNHFVPLMRTSNKKVSRKRINPATKPTTLKTEVVVLDGPGETPNDPNIMLDEEDMKLVRACSHEPGTVNYPGVMIATGQALPRVHMMICCPGATLPRVNFIAPG